MSRVAVSSRPYLRGLGDQIYDPTTGTYVDTLSQSDNPVSLPLAPDQATFNSNPYSYSGIAAGGAAGDSAQNFKAATGYSPNTVPTGILALPGVGVPAVPRPSPTVAVPLSTQSVGLWFSGSSFGIPNWMLLALGGVVLVGGGALGSRGRR